MEFNVLRLFFCALVPYMVLADTCLSPQVKSEVHTTTDATLTHLTVFIAKFDLKCTNNLKNINLYAEFNGKTVPVTHLADANQYQVSFSDEHKNLPAGRYEIRLYDDGGYTDLRKAQRSGEDVSKARQLFSVVVQHPGVSHGPYVQSELVAAAVALGVWYAAYHTRSHLQA